ncbi:bifunctional hydroxymethylpyrimidine kinase/phosphomethylpyrimidine kinase [uncultured Erythrobacter sp.]|uniref:bifunctional hydroxymethylpyrimidine kinase/phosphomethylpyrimidine kinase n=1 Tax=uncultured Erythrobacter sp. TaxID=263913 RepID=UPI002604D72C|nr:bifunctional hydroxymethylpyrimidine kinase/phosphomethylpyrimidine kinase [uncultured Erythrobacter sp.]
MSKPLPRILSIAGSDSSGGAGIQADIKTISMLGGYAMTAITAATAQNSIGVQAITPLSGEFVATQIRSCIDDIGVDAIKIGMLHDADIIAHTAKALADVDAPIVLDPVMIATSGAALIDQTAIAAMRDQLFPLATLLTPNLPELELLTDTQPRTAEAMGEAAMTLADKFDCHVLAKGGHTQDKRIFDVLVGPASRAVSFDHARIDTPHTHGTGCTLSSAIATLIGHGQPLEHAVRLGRRFVVSAIEAAPGFGAGNGPLGHQAVRSLK